MFSHSTSFMTIPTPSAACIHYTERGQSCGDPCQVNCCDEGGGVFLPYTKVMPEDRSSGVVITNECNICDCISSSSVPRRIIPLSSRRGFTQLQRMHSICFLRLLFAHGLQGQ
nr:uncharacterized protein LOC118878387 [Drosophila suzukii]